ncbi:MAG TPA: amidohydrolase family protein [Candidatus Polarisedimenticolaceae bacterium]|nr:amidohydrolase family protein [Candidatus Polarisedimenticolaceae bacterium]
MGRPTTIDGFTRRLLLVGLTLVAFGPLSAGDADGRLIITGVDVIPLDAERVLRDQSVVVERGLITRIGPATDVAVDETAVVIDGAGKYLLPGLFDMHMHIGEGQESDLTLYVANGVTTVQSMHGSPWHLALRERIAGGELLGPRLFTTGPTTATAGVDSPERAERFVDEQKEAGYDAIKQYGDGRDTMSRETYDRLIATAKARQIRVVGHAPRNIPFRAVLEARQDSIDHAEEIYYTYGPIVDLYRPHLDFQFGRTSLEDYRAADPPFPDRRERLPGVLAALATEMKRAGVALTPTLIAFETIRKQTTPEFDRLMQRPELSYVEPLTRASWGPRSNRYRVGWASQLAEMDRVLGECLELQKALVKALDDVSVPVMAGTDAPLTFVFPGFSLHGELEALVGAGLTPYRALRTATATPAEFLGIAGQAGTVQTGKRADLLLLDANPLADIRNTRSIRGVVVRGRWIPRSEIDSLLSRIAESYEPRWNEIRIYEAMFEAGEIRKALATYDSSKNGDERVASYLERTVNRIGYSYVRADDLARAIEVFTLNTEYFPDAFNTWDSLAEAHLLAGDAALARRYYEKSLALNPDNSNALGQLDELRELPRTDEDR